MTPESATDRRGTWHTGVMYNGLSKFWLDCIWITRESIDRIFTTVHFEWTDRGSLIVWWQVWRADNTTPFARTTWSSLSTWTKTKTFSGKTQSSLMRENRSPERILLQTEYPDEKSFEPSSYVLLSPKGDVCPAASKTGDPCIECKIVSELSLSPEIKPMDIICVTMIIYCWSTPPYSRSNSKKDTKKSNWNKERWNARQQWFVLTAIVLTPQSVGGMRTKDQDIVIFDSIQAKKSFLDGEHINKRSRDC